VLLGVEIPLTGCCGQEERIDMEESIGSGRSLISSYYEHAFALLKASWDNGTVCSLSAAFAFSINSLLVKLLDGRVPTPEIVLVRR